MTDVAKSPPCHQYHQVQIAVYPPKPDAPHKHYQHTFRYTTTIETLWVYETACVRFLEVVPVANSSTMSLKYVDGLTLSRAKSIKTDEIASVV